MCVCGEIGYAETTSGRQSATARATACEPSIWLRMRSPPASWTTSRGRASAAATFRSPVAAGEPLADRRGDGVERDDAGQRGERAEQRGVRERAPELLAGDLGRRHRHAPVGLEALHELAEPEVVEAAGVFSSR